jgi:hypothetical protein
MQLSPSKHFRGLDISSSPSNICWNESERVLSGCCDIQLLQMAKIPGRQGQLHRCKTHGALVQRMHLVETCVCICADWLAHGTMGLCGWGKMKKVDRLLLQKITATLQVIVGLGPSFQLL